MPPDNPSQINYQKTTAQKGVIEQNTILVEQQENKENKYAMLR
jgi:hypothetical protein